MTPEQIFLAEKIVLEAKKSGINPNFALGLLYQESQFMPSELGKNPEEIQDHIGRAMAMIQDLREAVGDDPTKIAAGFFAGGSGDRFAETGDINDLPPEILLRTADFIESFGRKVPSVFSAPSADEAFVPASPEPGFGDTPSAASTTETREAITDADIDYERLVGQLTGGTLGGAISAYRMGRDSIRGFPKAPAQPPAPPTATGTMRAAPPTPAGALPGPGQVQATTPGQKWAQAVTGVVRPGTESVVDAAAAYRREMPSGKVSKPTAQKYGIGAPLDIGRIAAQNAPPAQTGLQAVTNMFQRMAQTPLGKTAVTTGRVASRYGLPPVALASGFGEALGGYREFQKEKPDYVDVGLSGLGALGAGLSLFPATAPIGLPLAIGAPMLRQGLKRGAEPPPPPMDLMAP